MSTIASLVKRINTLLAVVEEKLEQVAGTYIVGFYNAATGRPLPEYDGLECPVWLPEKDKLN